MANLIKIAKKAVQTVQNDVSRGVAQLNPLDNGRTWKNPQGNAPQQQRQGQAAPSAIQQLTHSGAANVIGGAVKAPVQLLNTANLAGHQVADTARMMAATATNNPVAFKNANQQAQRDYNHYGRQNSGLAGQGTFFHNAKEAQSGSLKIVAPRIGGGMLQTAASVVPVGGGALAKGALAARAAKGAAAGAVSGGAFSAGSDLVEKGHIDKKSVIQGAGMGAVLGGGTPLASKGLHALPDKIRTSKLDVATRSKPTQSMPTSKLTSYEGAPDRARVEHYKQEIQANRPVKPLVVVKDSTGKLGVEDGKHRLQAYKELGINKVPAKLTTWDEIKRTNEGGYVRVPGASNSGAKNNGNIGKSSANGDGLSSSSVQKLNSKSEASQVQAKKFQQSVKPRTNQTSYTSGENGVSANTLEGNVASQTGKLQKLPKNQQILQATKSGPSRNNTPLAPGVKQRGFTSTTQNSLEVSPTVQSKVNGTYKVRNTARLQQLAENKARRNLKAATAEVNDTLAKPDGTISDREIANAIEVAKIHDSKGNFDQAQQIYDRLAEHGTKGGQQIQAFSLLSNRTPQGMKYQALKSLKKVGIELDNAGQKELQGLVDLIKRTQAGTPERNMALHELVQFVNKRLPSSLAEKAVNVWRAGLLTSPITTGGNILGNATEAATRNLWTNPISAGSDVLMSLVTGKRTKTLKGGQTKGAAIGLDKAKTYLKTGFDERNAAQKFDAKQVNYNNKVLNTYVNGVYRWMGGQDQPFYYAAQRQAARDLATADAKNLGLKGLEKDSYIARAESDPTWKPQTFRTKNNAENAAKYAVYQNDTQLGEAAAAASKKLGAPGQFLLPFKQVPASVAMRIIDRTPIGFGKEVLSQVLNKQFDQRALAESIGNGSFGIGVIGAGYVLGKSGLITGGYPADRKEQELWKLEGKQPYSVKVGNRWYSLNYMQPFGTLLGIGGQLHDDVRKGKDWGDAWSAAGATAAKSVESQSFLQGINGILSAVNDPQRSATQYITTTASSAVPNFVRTTARGIDPKQRDAKGVVQGVQSALPGVSMSLPAKQDAFGRDLNRKDNTANTILNPLRPSVAKDGDALVNELQRLQNTDNGIIPTQYNKSSITGQKLSNDQLRQLQAKVGPQVYDAWNKLIKDPQYQALSDADKATALKRANDAISGAGKASYQADNNMMGDKPLKLSSNEKQILNGQTPNYFAKSKSSGTTTINPNIDPHSQHILREHDNLDSDTINKKIAKEPDYEYKVKYAQYENKLANNSYSTAARIKAKNDLDKAYVGAKYPKDIRDLYSLSKNDLYDLVTTDPNGQAIADKLIAYDRDLYNSGLTSSMKFKYGISSSKGGRGKGGRKGSSFTVADIPSLKAPTIKAPRARNAPTYKGVTIRKQKASKSSMPNLTKLTAAAVVKQR